MTDLTFTDIKRMAEMVNRPDKGASNEAVKTALELIAALAEQLQRALPQRSPAFTVQPEEREDPLDRELPDFLNDPRL